MAKKGKGKRPAKSLPRGGTIPRKTKVKKPKTRIRGGFVV